MRVTRDARAFDSLDEALAAAEHVKDFAIADAVPASNMWLRRGSSDTVADLNDR